MAELKEIKSLKPMARNQMAADDWTVETLATANYLQLTTYKGVGTLGAQRIIKEAQELVNAERLAIARAKDGPLPEQASFTEAPASVRVRRARGETI